MPAVVLLLERELIIFVLYTLLVWGWCLRERRRWTVVLPVVLGALGLIAFNVIHGKLSDWTDGAIEVPMLRSLTYPYTALVVGVSLYLAWLPRDAGYGCRGCGYDLTGVPVTDGLTVCPECGRESIAPTTRRARRSGEDRLDTKASDTAVLPGGASRAQGGA